MGLKTKASSTKDFDLAPSGTHLAVCVAVIDLGTHTEQFPGQEAKEAHQVHIAWELVGEATRPVVGKSFTLSMHTKSSLRQWVKAWRGKDINDGEEFDPTVLAGKPCQITIEHKASGDRTFANLVGVSGLPKGMTCPKAEKDPIIFDLDSSDDPIFPDWMPFHYGKKLEDYIAEAHENTGGPKEAEDLSEPAASSNDTEDIPF